MASFLENYCTFASPLHGNGVKAQRPIASGEIIFDEKPYCMLQTLPNRSLVVVCGSCAKFLGSKQLQIEVLQKKCTRQDLASQGSSETIVPCSSGCGEVYCSSQCRDCHWETKGHKCLCTGKITDEEAEEHPLILFKMHAISTNEIFLLVADLFAAICVKADSLIANGASVDTALKESTEFFQKYVRELWWNAAVCPANQKPKAFKTTLKCLVDDAWSLLDTVLELTDKGYHTVLSAEFMSRTIGMFEQNNVGVRLKSPLAEYAESLNESTPKEEVQQFLDDTNKILEAVDDNAECCEDDEEDEDGEGEGDNEEVGQDDEDEEEQEEDTDENNAKASNGPLSDLRELIENEGLDTIYPPLDGTAFYELICQINHSCVPNVIVKYTMSPDKGLLAQLHALRDIAEGEEFVQSYVDQSMPFKKRQKALADYGFQCTCERCQKKE